MSEFEREMRAYAKDLGKEIEGVPVRSDAGYVGGLISTWYPCRVWRGSQLREKDQWSPVVPTRSKGYGIVNGVVVPLFAWVEELPGVGSIREAVRDFELRHKRKPQEILILRSENGGGVLLHMLEEQKDWEEHVTEMQDIQAVHHSRLRHLETLVKDLLDSTAYLDDPVDSGARLEILQRMTRDAERLLHRGPAGHAAIRAEMGRKTRHYHPVSGEPLKTPEQVLQTLQEEGRLTLLWNLPRDAQAEEDYTRLLKVLTRALGGPGRSDRDLFFYLDDVRNPRSSAVLADYVIARTIPEAKQILLSSDPFPRWSLDHDLGDTGGGTGMDFLKWAAEHALDKWPKGWVAVHSANPVGARNMRDFIDQVERELL